MQGRAAVNESIRTRALKVLELAAKATPGPWDAGWNTRYFDGDNVSMCGRGPDTIVMSISDPRFQSMVADPALHDAAFIAASHESAALVRELLAEVDALEKDARRYEFLRDGPLPYGFLFSISTKLLKFKGGGSEAIDKAIDAAMSDPAMVWQT